MRKITTRDAARQAVVAAVYAALCLLLTPFSFGETGIELRAAEMLIILLYFDKKYAYGLIVGCFIANLFSPLGIIDVVFGTLATALVCAAVSFLKGKEKKYFIGLIAALVNGVIVGTELWVVVKEAPLPLWMWMLTIFIGEFAVVEVAAFLAAILEKNNALNRVFAGETVEK